MEIILSGPTRKRIRKVALPLSLYYLPDAVRGAIYFNPIDRGAEHYDSAEELGKALKYREEGMASAYRQAMYQNMIREPDIDSVPSILHSYSVLLGNAVINDL